MINDDDGGSSWHARGRGQVPRMMMCLACVCGASVLLCGVRVRGRSYGGKECERGWVNGGHVLVNDCGGGRQALDLVMAKRVAVRVRCWMVQHLSARGWVHVAGWSWEGQVVLHPVCWAALGVWL